MFSSVANLDFVAVRLLMYFFGYANLPFEIINAMGCFAVAHVDVFTGSCDECAATIS